MNPMILVTLLCMGGLVSASGYGHGALALAGHYDVGYGGYGGVHKYGPAPLAHDGRVVDTPEVAHAKAAHAAAHAAAAARAPAHGSWSGHGGYAGYAAPAPVAYAGHGGYGGAPAFGSHGGYAAYAPAAHYGKWTGPPAHIELTHDGKFLKDTPEVAHAKAAHFAAYSTAAHAAAASPDYHSYESAHAGYGPAPGHGYGHGW